ncbi:hypothetical protein [Streptomyces sp. NPDC048392]|uniref:hypothetical protein n=1 Tax=Streptomyces sp. NPDC048392 TaxID=3365543 RepID=UPI003710564E
MTRGMEALTSNPALCEGKTIKYAEACFVVAAIHRNPRNPSVSLRPVNGGRTKVVRAASLLDAQEVKQDTIQPTPEHPAVIALRETIMSMRNEGIWRTLPDELEAFANEGAAVLAD